MSYRLYRVSMSIFTCSVEFKCIADSLFPLRQKSIRSVTALPDKASSRLLVGPQFATPRYKQAVAFEIIEKEIIEAVFNQ